MGAIVRVGVEWVDTFHTTPCHQNNLSYCDDQAEGFFNSMKSHGHTGVFDWGNDNAWETDLRHNDFGGDSLDWSDNVHFYFFDSHGGNSDDVLVLAFAIQHDNCLASSTKWRLGSKMLKWFVAAGCNAALSTDASEVVGVWGGPMQGVHIVMGYLGESADSWWTKGLGSDLADDVCNKNSIAGSWVDDAYSFWTGDHSIAIAAGNTQSDSVNRRDNETLDWRDIPIVETAWLAWKWKT
jgi:Family of unknown function (DUF6345)